MRKAFLGLIVGLLLGCAGYAAAYGGLWQKNGIRCTATGSGKYRGVMCWRRGSDKLVIVDQRNIIVMLKNGHVIHYQTGS